jgi:hypothetical protein
MTKEASAAVASVLILLVVFVCARLDPTRGFAFRHSHPTPETASAPQAANAANALKPSTSAPSLTTAVGALEGAETCELSPAP